ncbi:MAG: right-handed parallel beta-helix repeat-containing protein, partial [Gemmataceae bacterium]|nr:right-handed parallel beta-helix repeat-containing protein [Gemmataceae bacterium]
MARLPRFRPILRALESRLVPTTFTVLNTADDGPDSLRACIVAANGNAGADSIIFNSTAFASAQTITLTTGSLSITDALTITGPAAGVTVSGGGASQVFVTLSAPTSTAITLTKLTVTGGSAATGAGIAIGDESVTLSNCVFTGNTATTRGGGADLGLAAGVLTITACTFSGNSAPAGGGVTATTGQLTVDRSTFIDNRSTFASSGGAIRYVGGGNLNVINSTLTQNSAASNGGGIGFSGFTGIAVIRNSTIVGNTAGGGGQGGGIGEIAGSTGSVTVE